MSFPPVRGYPKEKLPPDRFRVDSARTAGHLLDYLPNQRAIWLAAKNGIDISNQKARKFYQDDFDLFDKIFSWIAPNLPRSENALTSNNKNKISMLSVNDEVSNTYYGNEDGFKKVFELVDKGCDQLSDKLQKPQS